MISENLTEETISMDMEWFTISINPNYIRLRRYFDIMFVILISPVVLPIVLLIMFILFFHFHGKIFFLQRRIGYLGKPFWIYKFKTMTDCLNSDEICLHHCEERVTRLGKFLRTHRIDEIPQLYNVLKGDMNIVGPRPEADYHYNYFMERIEYYSFRKSVPPGITGLSQINYPYSDSVEDTIEKLKYDFKYINSLSAKNDTLIVMRTILQMFTGKNS